MTIGTISMKAHFLRVKFIVVAGYALERQQFMVIK
jgi:hypothetical protein